MKAKHLIMLTLLGSAGLLSQCKKADDVKPDEDNELITLVKVKFKEEGTGVIKTFEWKDNDGDGGNPPQIDKVVLKTNTTYELTTEFWDGSKNPQVDITAEVKEKQDEHLVVYTSTPLNLLTYTYLDKDSRGYVVGLRGTVSTGSVQQGTLRLQLRHQPAINGTPVKNGTPTPGNDDVLVDFNVGIE